MNDKPKSILDLPHIQKALYQSSRPTDTRQHIKVTDQLGYVLPSEVLSASGLPRFDFFDHRGNFWLYDSEDDEYLLLSRDVSNAFACDWLPESELGGRDVISELIIPARKASKEESRIFRNDIYANPYEVLLTDPEADIIDVEGCKWNYGGGKYHAENTQIARTFKELSKHSTLYRAR